MENPVPPVTSRGQALWNVLKTFSPATAIGFVLLAAFLVCCQIDACVIRWWLMLPLAAMAGALLLSRRRRAPAVEARTCTVLLVLLLALVILRDIGLARKLAELYDKVQSYKTQYHQATSEIHRFFEGGR